MDGEERRKGSRRGEQSKRCLERERERERGEGAMEGRKREHAHTASFVRSFQPPSEAAELVLEHGAVLERIAACLLVRGGFAAAAAVPGPGLGLSRSPIPRRGGGIELS